MQQLLEELSKKLKTSKSITARFSEPLQNALINAAKAAKLSESKFITPKFLFVGMLMDAESVAYFLLDKMNLDATETIRRLVGYTESKILDVKLRLNKDTLLSEESKDIVLDSVRLAKEGKGYYVGTEHLLIALLRSGHEDIRFLIELAGSMQSLPNFVTDVLRATNSPFDLLKQVDTFVNAPAKPIPVLNAESSEPVVPLYTDDLTARNRQFSQYAPKKFRAKYSDAILSTLLRYSHKNIMIVGPSGIGKTALIDELAYRFTVGDVPISLRQKQILRLNMAAIIAMSKFPNEIDKQVLTVLNEIHGMEDVILYIDDFNSLVSSPMRGGLNMSASLKLFLESQGITLMVSMQDDDYRNFIENNKQLARFFSLIEIEEPTADEASKMIKDTVKQIEKEKKVKFEAGAVEASIRLTNTYIPDRVLPEKALEVLDIAASKKTFDYEYKFKSLGTYQAAYDSIIETKDRFVVMGDYEAAERLTSEEKELSQHIKMIKNDAKDYLVQNKPIITETDVKNIIAESTKLPLSTVTNDEMSSLLKLESNIKNTIISQEDAIRRVVSAVKRGRVGITNRNRPWASLLFLGPTGVGKTELAKTLAKILFGNDEDRLIQIDMSEFMEQHSVSKLIGSPPGYVGFEQGGFLTDKIAENPYSVVLFDEIEKAHPEVLNILLQILEDGHLTDSRGGRVSFQNSIIILTSNIGAEKINEQKVLGFYKDRSETNEISEADYEKMKEKLMLELKKKLRPELVNRLDDVIIFRTLTKEDVKKVVDIMLSDLNKRLVDLKMSVKVSEEGKQQLATDGFSSEYGARPLRRLIQHEIEDLIADYVLQNGYYDRSKMTAHQQLMVEYNSKVKKFELKK